MPIGDQHILTLPVEGMTCASCVARVEKVLKKIDGVSAANVNLATENVTVTFDAAKTGLDQLATAVSGAGYKLVLPGQTTDIVTSGRQGDSGESRQEQAYRGLKKDFFASLVLSLPIVAVSTVSMTDLFMRWIPVSMEDINKLLLIATTPVILIAGRRFYRIAWQQAKHLSADMNTLITVGTGVAYVYSAFVVLFPHWLNLGAVHADVYFDTAATIITLILLGRMLEARAKSKTSDAIHKLMHLRPKNATVVRDGVEAEVPLDAVAVNDRLIVRPGERIPVDGLILRGLTTIDESIVTGESLPVERSLGQKVVGGTINQDGAIEFQATAVGKDTVVAQIIRLVEEAQGSKAPIQALADKVASVFVPVVISIASLTFVLWYVVGGAGFTPAMMNFIAVLIIACPCALGLATPTAIIVGTGRGAAIGILIKNADSLKRLHSTQTVVLDKTGTITQGKPSVCDVVTVGETDERTFIRYVASVEKNSEHLLGKAIVGYAKKNGIPLTEADLFQAEAGFGVRATVDNRSIIVGKEDFLEKSSIDISGARQMFEQFAAEGKTVVLAAVDGRLVGVITLADTVHPTSKETVSLLKTMRIDVVMLTGDNAQTARAIAEQIDVEHFIAGVLPQDKSLQVKKIQAAGKIVAMVGDGINDAPALAQADVGIAMGTGTDIAMEAADVTLMRSDLRGVVQAIKLSKQTIRTIRQNLFWAFIYNVIGIPLAALGMLSPVLAAGAMAFSSVSVVSNSLRIRWKQF
jgi:Cu+-exporting ATPase